MNDKHNAFLRQSESPVTGEKTVALADNILTKGGLGTAGSRMLHNFIPPYGATVADKLTAAGFSIAGKTNLPEFGMGEAGSDACFGPTLHPHDDGHISLGAAAAVALGFAPLALAVDSCGQARKHAAFAGVTCLKPTYGTVSRFGVVPYTESTEVVSILANNMAEAATLYDIIAGHDEKDATTYPEASYNLSGVTGAADGMKIALPRQYFTDEVEPEVRVAISQFCERLQALGANISEVELPLAVYAHAALFTMAAAEGAHNISRYDGIKYGWQSEHNRTVEEIYVNSRSEAFGDEAKRVAILGAHVLSRGTYHTHYLKALQIRRLLCEQAKALFRDYDLLLMPPARGLAYDLRPCSAYYEDYWRDGMYTALASLAGLPAAVLPLGLSAQGLPIGVQLLADTKQEAKLVQLALACEL